MLPENLKSLGKTRLDNNPVERHFGILKNSILPKKKMYPSELMIAIYTQLLVDFLQMMPQSQSKCSCNEGIISISVNLLLTY